MNSTCGLSLEQTEVSVLNTAGAICHINCSSSFLGPHAEVCGSATAREQPQKKEVQNLYKSSYAGGLEIASTISTARHLLTC